MATRDTLAGKLAGCSSSEDLYNLAREAMDAPADYGFAQEALSKPEFAADATARSVLDNIAGGAMFTNDFIALAMGYKFGLKDDAKAEEMLGQGQDFAMSGEEKVAVGVGQMLISGDAAAAAKTLGGALKEISTTEDLYALAKVAATQVKDAALAGQVYDKIKGKCGRAADFARLAKTLATDLGDKTRAVEIVNEGAGKYGSPADLIVLSGAMGEIDPAAAGALYDKALDSAKDFTALMQVLDAAKGNEAFTKAVLAKGGNLASKTGEFLQLAEANAAAGDAAAATAMLTAAEDAVANLDEMRRIVDAVNKVAAQDTERVARLQGKLAKREANQAKYVEFQNQEAQAKTVKQFIALADGVMAELEDTSYAGKLLGAAEDLMRADGFHFSRFKPLILAVDRLGDKAWLGKLLEESVASAGDFVWFREIVLTAAREFKDAVFGKDKAKAYLDARAASAGDNAYDWTKLAQTYQEALGDKDTAARLLGEAANRAKDHLALAHVGKLYRDLGDAANAKSLFDKAAAACSGADQCVQLASRMKSYEMPASEIVPVMEACGGKLAGNLDKLRWAEGVSDLLLDADWAARAYARIESGFSAGSERKLFERSRQMRTGYRFFGPGVQAH